MGANCYEIPLDQLHTSVNVKHDTCDFSAVEKGPYSPDPDQCLSAVAGEGHNGELGPQGRIQGAQGPGTL